MHSLSKDYDFGRIQTLVKIYFSFVAQVPISLWFGSSCWTKSKYLICNRAVQLKYKELMQYIHVGHMSHQAQTQYLLFNLLIPMKQVTSVNFVVCCPASSSVFSSASISLSFQTQGGATFKTFGHQNIALFIFQRPFRFDLKP